MNRKEFIAALSALRMPFHGGDPWTAEECEAEARSDEIGGHHGAAATRKGRRADLLRRYQNGGGA